MVVCGYEVVRRVWVGGMLWWKDGEVTGRRGSGCEWPGSPPNLLLRQNKKQPEREILENGKNPEIRKKN